MENKLVEVLNAIANVSYVLNESAISTLETSLRLQNSSSANTTHESSGWRKSCILYISAAFSLRLHCASLQTEVNFFLSSALSTITSALLPTTSSFWFQMVFNSHSWKKTDVLNFLKMEAAQFGWTSIAICPFLEFEPLTVVCVCQ